MTTAQTLPTFLSILIAGTLALSACSSSGGDPPADSGPKDQPAADKDQPGPDGPKGPDKGKVDQGPAVACEKKCTDQAGYLCVTDPSTKRCVECLNDNHCAQNPGSAGETCDTSAKYCGCSGNTECATKDFGKKCHGTDGVCSCTVDGDCSGGKKCIGNFFGTKVCKKPCSTNADCNGNMFKRVCDPKTGCEECVQNSECGPNKLGNTCTNGLCTCVNAGDCAGKKYGIKCLTSNSCGCENDFDCPSGSACTGMYLDTKICK